MTLNRGINRAVINILCRSIQINENGIKGVTVIVTVRNRFHINSHKLHI